MHAHYAIPHAATAWLAKQMLKDEGLDLKIVTTLHGTDITLVGQDPSYYTLTKFSIEQSDAVTAVSAYLRDETYRAFGCGQCDLRVIPNFVSTTDYHPPTDDTNRKKLAPQGHRVLVHVSNFRPVKRVGDVVKVFASVRTKIPATLVLVGDGPDRDAAEQQVDSLGLHKDVRGLAALEAMACAVPVIASAAGGIPEVVEDGKTGFLASPGDVATMADRALRVLEHPDEHARLRQHAAQRALEFSADKVVPRYESLYQEVLS